MSSEARVSPREEVPVTVREAVVVLSVMNLPAERLVAEKMVSPPKFWEGLVGTTDPPMKLMGPMPSLAWLVGALITWWDVVTPGSPLGPAEHCAPAGPRNCSAMSGGMPFLKRVRRAERRTSRDTPPEA